MITAAKNILITEMKIDLKKLEFIADLWKGSHKVDSRNEASLYISTDLSSIMEVRSLGNFSELESIIDEFQTKFIEENRWFNFDWRRRLLTLKDVVKDQDSPVPTTKYLQLRHIEVPLCNYDEYIQWRKRTIFNHVKNQAVIHSFIAYHTKISTEPGVMFFSGFNGAIAEYMESFQKSEYVNIVKEAGLKYIAGGEKGLYTALYQRY